MIHYDQMYMNDAFTDLLKDFGPNVKAGNETVELIHIRVPADAKARYAQLQAKSGRKFSKTVREALIALIEAAEARIA